MENVLIIVPTEREAAFFASHGLAAYICGVGIAECAAATSHLITDRKPDLAILAGIAGTYTDELKIGETVVVASETVADLGRREPDGRFTPLSQKTYSAGFVPEGFPAVHSSTVSTAGGLISRCCEVEIENMEGAAFFAVCERFGVRAMEVRTVSNRVGEPVTAENLNLAASRLASDLKTILASCV